MPGRDELGRIAHAIENPYDEGLRRISPYTAAEIATLQSRLDRQLGPEYIATRAGQGGGRVHYVTGEKVINLANEVFGFNGWSSSIMNVQVDFCDSNENTGKVDLGLSVIVRVTLRDGTFHEDIGYGKIENCKGKGSAFEKAKKEGATDGLKRALRNFGRVLGNCLYDKDYLQKVSKMKVQPARFDETNLHRHPDLVKKETHPSTNVRVAKALSTRNRSEQSVMTDGSGEYGIEDEFDGSLFDGVVFDPTEGTRIEDTAMADHSHIGYGQETPIRQPAAITNGTDTKELQIAKEFPRPLKRDPVRPSPNQGQTSRPAGPLKPLGPMHAPSKSSDHPEEEEGNTIAIPPLQFVAGRSLQDNIIKPFNPAAKSTSIRRTAGVDPTKSAPIRRSDIGGQSESAGSALPKPPVHPTLSRTTNFVNPSADPNRKIGVPQSPMINRGPYKPPTAMKRPAPAVSPQRIPLAETTNVVQGIDSPILGKKIKVDDACQPIRTARSRSSSVTSHSQEK